MASRSQAMDTHVEPGVQQGGGGSVLGGGRTREDTLLVAGQVGP